MAQGGAALPQEYALIFRLRAGWRARPRGAGLFCDPISLFCEKEKPCRAVKEKKTLTQNGAAAHFAPIRESRERDCRQ